MRHHSHKAELSFIKMTSISREVSKLHQKTALEPPVRRLNYKEYEHKALGMIMAWLPRGWEAWLHQDFHDPYDIILRSPVTKTIITVEVRSGYNGERARDRAVKAVKRSPDIVMVFCPEWDSPKFVDPKQRYGCLLVRASRRMFTILLREALSKKGGLLEYEM